MDFFAASNSPFIRPTTIRPSQHCKFFIEKRRFNYENQLIIIKNNLHSYQVDQFDYYN
jgi:hypothetical protein